LACRKSEDGRVKKSNRKKWVSQSEGGSKIKKKGPEQGEGEKESKLEGGDNKRKRGLIKVTGLYCREHEPVGGSKKKKRGKCEQGGRNGERGGRKEGRMKPDG